MGERKGVLYSLREGIKMSDQQIEQESVIGHLSLQMCAKTQ